MNWNDIFIYDPVTGELRWKIDKGTRGRAGFLVGSVSEEGYLRVSVDRKTYTAHCIIWDMLHPDDLLTPGYEIDHIDHDRLNNRASNLRKVNKQGNQRNASRRKDNTTGVTGVHWFKPTNRWTAQIFLDGRQQRLGYFLTLLDAVAARKSAEIQHGFHENHGR
ncbi:HNH endonuclease [Salmonella enterica]